MAGLRIEMDDGSMRHLEADRMPLDAKQLAAMLAMYDVDYVITGRFADEPHRLLEPMLSDPLQVDVGGEEDNLEAVADALFALRARKVGSSGPWRPWPATPGHLEGLVDTIAGRVLIQVVACLGDRAQARELEVGGSPVVLEMAREPNRLSAATRRRLADQL